MTDYKMVPVELLPCPCGEIPANVRPIGDAVRAKYAEASGDCCGEWIIEFRNSYETDMAAICANAVRAWNDAPRAAPPQDNWIFDDTPKPIEGRWYNVLVDNRVDHTFKIINNIRIGSGAKPRPEREVLCAQLMFIDPEDGGTHWAQGTLASGSPLRIINNVVAWQQLPAMPQDTPPEIIPGTTEALEQLRIRK